MPKTRLNISVARQHIKIFNKIGHGESENSKFEISNISEKCLMTKKKARTRNKRKSLLSDKFKSHGN